MRHMLLRIAFLVTAALLVSVGVAAANGTLVSAKSKVNKAQVRLCLNYTTGNVRAPRANRCKAGERYVTVRIAKNGKTAAGFQGPQGPQGPAGTTGEQGAAGATGSQGPAGAKGATGPRGDKGDTGPAGAPGLDGQQGPQGAKGDKGDKGDTGDTGAQGPQGPAGPQGPQGDKGDTGPQGPAGPAVSTATATVCVNPSGVMKWSDDGTCGASETPHTIYVAP